MHKMDLGIPTLGETSRCDHASMVGGGHSSTSLLAFWVRSSAKAPPHPEKAGFVLELIGGRHIWLDARQTITAYLW